MSARAACGVLQLLLPVLGIGVRDLGFADHAVEDQVEQPVLASDMPVEGGRPGVELVGDAAHAQLVEAVPVEQPERRLDDQLLRDRFTAAASPAPERVALPGRRWDGGLIHVSNSVTPIEQCLCRTLIV